MKITVEKKAVFGKKFDVMFRGTDEAKKLCDDISANNFCKYSFEASAMNEKWVNKRYNLTGTAVADYYKALKDNTEKALCEHVTSDIYDAYAFGADNTAKKTTFYDVFATSVIAWFKAYGFNCDKKTVDFIAMRIGMNLSSGKYLLTENRLFKPMPKKTFAKKYMYAVSELFGDTVKNFDIETMIKRACLVKNDKGKWVSLKQ